ncbi:conserved hypothethical protein (plasmid) [Ralstonia solanacearum CMR15]|nr:conserved hypothethical protein [Ralstonia solanacearum CMR15]
MISYVMNHIKRETNELKREKSMTKRGKLNVTVALLPALLFNDEEEMLTLTKKELAVLDEAQPDYAVYLVETEHENTRWWRMTVKLPAHEKIYEVVTALGKTKLWKRLDIAIDFIKESCPHTKTVFVVFAP